MKKRLISIGLSLLLLLSTITVFTSAKTDFSASVQIFSPDGENKLYVFNFDPQGGDVTVKTVLEKLLEEHAGEVSMKGQIGRASCRERV